MPSIWYDSAKSLSDFQNILIDAEVLETSEEIKDYLAKPYRYDEMWDAWKEADYPSQSDERWQEFIDAISEEDSDDDTSEPE